MIETLGDLITLELRKRGVSLRELGRIAGVSHSTLGRIISDPDYAPTVRKSTLKKIAQIASMDVNAVERLAKGSILRDPDAEIRIWVELIRSLPPDQRKVIETMLRGFNQANGKG